MDAEEWRPVPSVPGILASSLGRIKAEPRAGNMPHGGQRIYQGKAWPGAWAGDRYTTRYRGKTYKVARLVCEAFHGAPPFPRAVCMHLDESARNNRPENLRWGTQKENLNFPGFLAKLRGRPAKLSPTAVEQIRARRMAGEKLTAIASDYGIDYRTVSEIARGKVYRETRA